MKGRDGIPAAAKRVSWDGCGSKWKFPLWCNKNLFSCLSLLREISLKLLLNSLELRRQTLGNFKFEGHVAIGVGIGA